MLTKMITLRHLAFGLTIYSAVFNAVALLVLSCTDTIRLALTRYSDVSGAVRSIPADAWLLFCVWHLAVQFCKQKIDGARTGRRRRHLSFGCRRNDVHTR